MRRSLTCFHLLGTAGALWLVLAALTGAAELRVMTWNVAFGLGAPGSPEFLAAKEIVQRLRPDVIAFQEVDAQDANPANAAHFSDLRELLFQVGFQTTRQFFATAGDGFQNQTYVAAEFGTSTQCLAFASRFPITRTVQIGRGVAGKKEFSRFPLLVQLDVPGTQNDPTFVTVHFKQGDTQADEFRRGVEALRTRQFLEASGINGAAQNVFVLGDFNEEINEPQTLEFPTANIGGGSTFADGSSLPATYQLGPDIPTTTLRYGIFPISAFEMLGLRIVPASQTDGLTDRTYAVAGNSRLDYLLAGDFTRSAGSVRAEVYNSGREPVGDGLPKDPTLPAPGLSLIPSDHFALVADVALDPMPILRVGTPAGPFTISFAALTLQGSVDILPASATPLTVTLAPFREAPLHPIPPVTIPAGERSAPFSCTVQGTPFGSERRITLVASAAGYRDGIGTIITRRTGVSGEVIISQYTETPSGSTPKALEILNVCSRDLVFATEPLRVLFFANGASVPTTDALVETGRLPRGAVMVIGDNETGAYLVAQGLLAGTTASAISNAASGTVFTDDGTPTGRVLFVKDSFIFNGNDALELQLNYARADVFGQPGTDPGTAWTTSGSPMVSTTNQNLSRRAAALAASPGWSSPGLFFEVSGTTLANALVGFGVAPALTDPYGAWTLARGLSGPAAAPTADPDGNGRSNLSDFVFGTMPADLTYSAAHVRIALTTRNQLGNLRWGTEESADGQTWHKTSESPSPITPPTGEFSPLTLTLPVAAPLRLIRFFVEKP